MRYLINSISSYFLWPVYFAVLLLFIFFNVPNEYHGSIFALLAMITFVFIWGKLCCSISFDLYHYYRVIKFQHQYKQVIFLFCVLVVMLGPVDIYMNGLKIVDASSYATFYSGGRYIRHITNFCWILVPTSYLFVKSPFKKALLLTYAIVFPILIVDRNRLFMSFYAWMLFFILDNRSFRARKGLRAIFFIASYVFIFAVLGQYRSGAGFQIASSGSRLLNGMFPLSEAFLALPAMFKQIVLYVTTPIFNFATVASEGFNNPEFLLNQLSPFDREHLNPYPYAPVWVPRFNVGTEFYPFLLFGGLPIVFVVIAFLFFSFVGSIYLLKKSPNIFTFLIFIKISYCVLFMGFAPQFYLFYNVEFLLITLLLWAGAFLMKNGRYAKLLYIERGGCETQR